MHMDAESPLPNTATAYDSHRLASSFNRVTASINRAKRLFRRIDCTLSNSPYGTDSSPDWPASSMGTPMSTHSGSRDSGIGGESSGNSSGLSTPSASGTSPTTPSTSTRGSSSTSRSSNSSRSRVRNGGTPGTSGTGRDVNTSTTVHRATPSTNTTTTTVHRATPSTNTTNTTVHRATPSTNTTNTTVHRATPSTNTTTTTVLNTTPSANTTITTTVASSGSSNQGPSYSGQTTPGGSSLNSATASPGVPSTSGSGGGYRRRYVPKTKCIQESAAFGYDCKWVGEPPYSLICPICLCVARRPRQRTCCGSIYCTRCLLMYSKQATYVPGKMKECPNCRRSSTDFSDRRAELEINQLLVSCDNSNSGCPWTGELSHLKYHVNDCDHVIVYCTECGHSLLRRNYMAHRQTCLEKKKRMELPKPAPPKTVLAQPVFKLEGYSRHKETGIPWCSPPFYLHPIHSYKMCIEVSFFKNNGTRMEENVTFSLHLMKGEEDSKLSWPLKLSVTFVLLNQHHDGHHYSNTTSFQADQVTEGERHEGCVLMEFKRPPYDRTIDLQFYQNRNDTIYFKIEVRYSDDCGTPLPWLSPVIK